jgi:hypothetical protein
MLGMGGFQRMDWESIRIIDRYMVTFRIWYLRCMCVAVNVNNF